MKRFGLALDNHSCLTLSVDVACLSSDISVVPEDDLRPLNFGLATARRRALDRSAWRLLVETATSTWRAPEKEREREICYLLSSVEIQNSLT